MGEELVGMSTPSPVGIKIKTRAVKMSVFSVVSKSGSSESSIKSSSHSGPPCAPYRARLGSAALSAGGSFLFTAGAGVILRKLGIRLFIQSKLVPRPPAALADDGSL